MKYESSRQTTPGTKKQSLKVWKQRNVYIMENYSKINAKQLKKC